MKFKDLNRQEYKVDTSNYFVKASDTRPRSKLHHLARNILNDLFPAMPVVEELPIKFDAKGFSSSKFIDFFIPTFKMIIEVHGEQHYKFNTMFHSTPKDFADQKKRDLKVQEWCAINGFWYIELPYNEEEEQWRHRLTHLSP